jgi:alkanesulfonate monooxygenase SsuD/methylene tetrahydromethanopterin reductase-like flavin-dependent oxidoreductase (luciferase family)
VAGDGQALAAWDAHTLSLLSDYRFDLGIGTGRPEAVKQAAERLGEPEGTGAERLERVARTIEELRALDGERHTPVLMAVGGPRAQRVAAEHADIVTIAIGALGSREEIAARAEAVREAAAGRTIQLALNVMVVGDSTPPGLERFIGASAEELRRRDSLAWLPEDAVAMRDELERRVTELGLSYAIVNAAFMDAVAPVVAELASAAA